MYWYKRSVMHYRKGLVMNCDKNCGPISHSKECIKAPPVLRARFEASGLYVHDNYVLDEADNPIAIVDSDDCSHQGYSIDYATKATKRIAYLLNKYGLPQ